MTEENNLHKILFVRKSNSQVGGVEMQMIRQARWLMKQGIATSVLATNDLKGPLAELFRKEGFEVKLCMMTGPFYLVKSVIDLYRITNDSKVKITQAHMFRESLICRVLRIFRPSVLHYFRIETYIDCSPVALWKKNAYHLVAQISAGLVEHYFVNGRIVYEELKNRSHADEKIITIVYNGVEQFGSVDRQPISFDPDGSLRIIMVANLIAGKGHELLFHAISALEKSGCLVRAYLYGDEIGQTDGNSKPYKQQLTELVSALGINNRVVFRGFTVELNNELSLFQVLVLPSYSEGTPNCVLEAMSTRKLVIVSDAGELPFMVEHGISGFVHPRGDQEKLMEFLETASHGSSEYIETIRDNGLKRWAEMFSLDSMMKQVKGYYNQLKQP